MHSGHFVISIHMLVMMSLLEMFMFIFITIDISQACMQGKCKTSLRKSPIRIEHYLPPSTRTAPSTTLLATPTTTSSTTIANLTTTKSTMAATIPTTTTTTTIATTTTTTTVPTTTATTTLAPTPAPTPVPTPALTLAPPPPPPPATAPPDPCARPCAPEWVKAGCFCYKNTFSKSTYAQAIQKCTQLGGRLPIFNLAHQWANFQQFRISQGAHMHQDFWIGLDDLAQEGNFRWIDGSPLGFGTPSKSHPWDNRGPDDIGRNSCTGCADCVRSVFTLGYAWQDDMCELLPGHLVVCQKLP